MTFRRIEELLVPTDPAIVEAGAGGERLVARTRVVFWAAIWLIPIVTLLTMDAPPPEVWIGFAASSLALLISGWIVVITRRRCAVATPFLTTAFDVTLVTVTLAAVALAGRPLIAINSHIIWPVYLLAIVATAFRFDFRVCLFAGIAGAVEYFVLLQWVVRRWNLSADDAGWATQFGKILLLFATTALAAGLIHQARKLAHVSGNDRLTSLGNRALFDEKLRIEISRAERESLPLTLAFLDLDHFKKFNDRWGHKAGDNALRLVADALRGELRATDSAFRWGGEEMIVLLPSTTRSGAVVILERLRDQLRGIPLPDTDADVRVTISAGVAEFPEDAASAEELLRRADQRVYAAKRAGRDRIVADRPIEVRRSA